MGKRWVQIIELHEATARLKPQFQPRISDREFANRPTVHQYGSAQISGH